jgi:hypothetical protein
VYMCVCVYGWGGGLAREREVADAHMASPSRTKESNSRFDGIYTTQPCV